MPKGTVGGRLHRLGQQDAETRLATFDDCPGDELAGLGLADPQFRGVQAVRVQPDPQQQAAVINADGA